MVWGADEELWAVVVVSAGAHPARAVCEVEMLADRAAGVRSRRVQHVWHGPSIRDSGHPFRDATKEKLQVLCRARLTVAPDHYGARRDADGDDIRWIDEVLPVCALGARPGVRAGHEERAGLTRQATVRPD